MTTENTQKSRITDATIENNVNEYILLRNWVSRKQLTQAWSKEKDKYLRLFWVRKLQKKNN
jgi:hypothetical protein